MATIELAMTTVASGLGSPRARRVARRQRQLTSVDTGSSSLTLRAAQSSSLRSRVLRRACVL